MALLYINELDARKAKGVFYRTPHGGWIAGEVLKTCDIDELKQMAEHADMLADFYGTTPALFVTTICEEGYTFVGSEHLIPFSRNATK